jgi:8-oxo-dGTP pyrophosphatase MutT (NUDIX family)
MEKMTNRPCLDMNKLIEEIKNLCANIGVSSIDDEPFLEVINKCFIGWFSRSMATALFAFCKDEDGDWCVLASERGLEAADFRGMWNCPCGYLDYDETTKECAVRECFEETGVKIPIDSLVFINYEDDPVTANRQNVTFRFGAKIEDHITTDFKFSKENNEGAEVGEIKWVKIKDIDNYEWAFNHKTRIEEISLQLRLWDEDEDV